MGSYYLPSDITFQEHTKEKFEAIKKRMLRAEMLSPKTVKNILNAFNVPPPQKKDFLHYHQNHEQRNSKIYDTK